jgi:hypothetical protein
MYIRTILDTIRFNAVMAMNLLELCGEVCFCESSTRMGDLLRSLVQKNQKQTILYHWVWVVTQNTLFFLCNVFTLKDF